MPVLFIDVPGNAGLATRAHLAEAVTAPLVKVLKIEPDKVQVFFRVTMPAGLMTVTAHVVAGPDLPAPGGGTLTTKALVAAALDDAGFKDPAVIDYQPDHTAKGGELRTGAR